MKIASGGRPLPVMLDALSADARLDCISVGDLLAALGDRATAALLFIFAFPNVLPTPPGTSTILGAPLIFLAAQLMLGRTPWLPAFVAKRSMTRADFSSLAKRIVPGLVRAESLLRPRLPGLAKPPMEQLIGLLSLLLAVVLVLPIPLGNVLPALVAASVVSGVVYAMVNAGV
ncbi:MAG: exopolysaccharide biosynthesis protein [Polaromonas sp.]|nr:exopolysaccharide biosynthesis protein [Polaromonas sp.]